MKKIFAALSTAALVALGGCAPSAAPGGAGASPDTAVEIVQPEDQKILVDFKSASKTLTLSGKGAVFNDYDHFDLMMSLSSPDDPEHVVIEPGITELGGYCFAYSEDGESGEARNSFDKIKTVSIADSVVAIGWDAFSFCGALESVELPRGLVDLGSGAFSNCTSLKTITLPGTLYAVPRDCFSECTALEEVVLQPGIAAIGEDAFSNTNLRSITLPDTLTEIDDGAFSDSALSDVRLPDSLTRIGEYAFASCPQLHSVTIPASVAYIGQYAFGYIRSQVDYEFHKSEDFIIRGTRGSAAEAYARQNGFTFESEDGTSDRKTAENTVRYTYDGDTLRISGSGSLSYGDDETAPWETEQKNAKHLVIENGIAEIDNGVFFASFNGDKPTNAYGKLESVEVAGSVRRIGGGVFENCRGLRSLKLAEGIADINANAFSGCSALENVEIPGSVIRLGTEAFANCTSLKSVRLHAGTTSLQENAFGGCTALTSFDMGDTVARLDYNTFSGCTALTDIRFSESLRTIGEYAFRDCSALTEITLPDSLTSIEESAFEGCTSLRSVTIPASVRYIGQFALGYYTNDATFNYVRNKDFTIKGYKNTAAEQYALDNDFTFETLDK